MIKNMTLKNRAVHKVIECINSSKNLYHLAACKKMINLLYNYDIKSSSLTYVMLKYRSKHKELHDG